MSLVIISSKSLADSSIINNNFRYLEDLINSVAGSIYSNNSTLDSAIETLNEQLTNKIQKIVDNLSKQQIGSPIITLSNTLNENEIWLEGANISRTTYSDLFAIYGTTYGTGDGVNTFTLPNCIARVIQGANSFGYIEAGLPQHTHTITLTSRWGNSNQYANLVGWCTDNGTNGSGTKTTSNASSSIYKSGSTVQPPAIKVRVKTRYE